MSVWPVRRVLNENDAYFQRQTDAEKARLRRIAEPPTELGPTRKFGGVMVPTTPGHFVYAHLDANGSPLYVGKTSQPAQRCSHHSARSAWWELVSSIVWERQANADAMYWRELEIIDLLQPKFNITGTDRRQRRQRGERRLQRMERERQELAQRHATDSHIASDLRRALAHGYPLRDVFDALASTEAAA